MKPTSVFLYIIFGVVIIAILIYYFQAAKNASYVGRSQSGVVVVDDSRATFTPSQANQKATMVQNTQNSAAQQTLTPKQSANKQAQVKAALSGQ